MGQLEAKQAELDTAAGEATRLQGRFEEQARQLTKRSEQAESLQISLDTTAAVHSKLSEVCLFLLDVAVLCCIAGLLILNTPTDVTGVDGGLMIELHQSCC